jgi:hypothetical protein
VGLGLGFRLHTDALISLVWPILAMRPFDHKSNSFSLNTNGKQDLKFICYVCPVLSRLYLFPSVYSILPYFDESAQDAVVVIFRGSNS